MAKIYFNCNILAEFDSEQQIVGSETMKFKTIKFNEEVVIEIAGINAKTKATLLQQLHNAPSSQIRQSGIENMIAELLPEQREQILAHIHEFREQVVITTNHVLNPSPVNSTLAIVDETESTLNPPPQAQLLQLADEYEVVVRNAVGLKEDDTNPGLAIIAESIVQNEDLSLVNTLIKAEMLELVCLNRYTMQALQDAFTETTISSALVCEVANTLEVELEQKGLVKRFETL